MAAGTFGGAHRIRDRIAGIASGVPPPIQTHLPNVAVHVVEAPVVRQIRTDRGVKIIVAALTIFTVFTIAAKFVQVFVVIGLFAGVGVVVPSLERSGPAGIFPLGFRGKVESFGCLRAQLAHEGVLVHVVVGRPGGAFFLSSDHVIGNGLNRSHVAFVT